MLTILEGDCRSSLRTIDAGTVQTCVTSPPYYALRDYKLPPLIWGGDPSCPHQFGQETKRHRGGPPGASTATNGRDQSARSSTADIVTGSFCRCGAWRGSLGLEPNPDLYVEHMIEVFREVRRVLRDDGTLWMNLGDTYASTGGHTDSACSDRRGQYNLGTRPEHDKRELRVNPSGEIKEKDLLGMPWRVAFALQRDGWYLRCDIVWHKPNPMPESVKDRPTRSHEYIFLLSKSARYHYDARAIMERASPDSHARYARGRSDKHKYADGGPGNQTIARTFEHMRRPAGWANSPYYRGQDPRWKNRARGVNPKVRKNELSIDHRKHGLNPRVKQNESFAEACSKDMVTMRNKRSVWSVVTQAYPESHFATFPEDLIKPCILAGAPAGAMVLDPFGGSGTVGRVSIELGRRAILCELNHDYCEMIRTRTTTTPGLPL